MSQDWVKIEIDGKSFEARKGSMIIEVADAADIGIPRFCYHKKLSIAANCRMCLVEVERAPKPLPACATPVNDGMVVRTRSPKALGAQRNTMEFLLINHPLDCPICDQGGECELQDVAMGYGDDVSRFTEGKRVVVDKDIGPLIHTDMTRCIHCTRCVRFGDEIAGLRELGAVGRGEDMEIGTYIGKSIVSELSGNVIDLCPVGALVNKPAHYKGRSWEYVQHSAVAPHDSVGSNLFLHTIRGHMKRVVPRENEAINETWLADRDRFSFLGAYSPDRALSPWLKDRGEVPWEEALEAAAQGLKGVVERHGPDAVGVLVSPGATLEEMYLLQKLARGLGIVHIDHRLRQGDFSDPEADPVYPGLGQAIEDLETLDAALLMGANPALEQPLLGHRLRKAALAGAKVMAIGSRSFEFRFPLAAQAVVDPMEVVQVLAQVARAVAEQRQVSAPENLAQVLDVAVDDRARTMAEALLAGEHRTVLLGVQAVAHPAFALLRALATFIARHSGAVLGYLPEAGNSVGGWLAGVVPHRGPGATPWERPGLDARAMVETPRRAYVLLNLEPQLDCWDGATTVEALRGAEFVLALTPFADGAVKGYAHGILPTTVYPESFGTYVNAAGHWQSTPGAVPPPGEARPGWKVLRVLANALDLPGFDYLDAEGVLADLDAACRSLALPAAVDSTKTFAPYRIERPVRIAEVPIYAADPLVRRSEPLQQTPLAIPGAARLNPATAEALGLVEAQEALVRQGGREVVLPVVIDPGVADGCVRIDAGLAATAGLGQPVGSLTLSAVPLKDSA